MQIRNIKNIMIAGLVVCTGMTISGNAEDQTINQTKPYGYWMTQGDDVLVEVKECSTNEICAEVVWTEEPAVNTKLIGAKVLRGFQYKRGAWRGGRVYDPASGKAYYANIKIQSGSKMTLKTCALGKCYPQEWTRADAAIVKSAKMYAANK
jgi:uncharacterized protein (DUF2147 family)